MTEPAPLRTCEQEPLHRSGAIQPHGALLLLDGGKEVTHVSANIADYLGSAPERLLGSTEAARWFPEIAGLKRHFGAQARYHVAALGPGGVPLDVVLTRRQDGGVGVELFHAVSDASVPNVVPQVWHPTELLRTLSTALPFERLMYYQLRDDEDGEVVAEVRTADDIGSYDGLRFPAADIPKIARALYRTNPWRLIPDAEASPVPLIGLFDGPPDLSRSDARSVSPVHCAYLANMGVRASLSIPVSVGERLHALVACHHRQPTRVSNQTLQWARRVVDLYQLHHFTELSRERMRAVDGAATRWAPILEDLNSFPRADRWEHVANALMSHFKVDAVALHRGGVWLHSARLSRATLDALLAWAHKQARVVCTTDRIGLGAPPAEDYCGCVAMAYGWGGNKTWLLLLRREHIHEVAWGGRPDKPEECDAGPFPISPRRSFDRWVELRRGYCRPWSQQTTLYALQLRSQLQAAARG